MNDEGILSINNIRGIELFSVLDSGPFTVRIPNCSVSDRYIGIDPDNDEDLLDGDREKPTAEDTWFEFECDEKRDYTVAEVLDLSVKFMETVEIVCYDKTKYQNMYINWFQLNNRVLIFEGFSKHRGLPIYDMDLGT